MTPPIKNNGYREVTVDMGNISCMKEPYVIDLGEGIQFILRYDHSLRDDDYGTLYLERMAK